MRASRLVQIASFLLFAGLLHLAAYPLVSGLPVDAFLRLDPAAALAGALAGRAWIPAYLSALAVVAATALLGRFFCGWICPLGATLDVSDRLLGPTPRRPSPGVGPGPWEAWRPLKHQVLLALLVCALLGVSLAFLVAPLALATRFYGLLINAMIGAAATTFLDLIRPLAERLNWSLIVYADPQVPRFSWQWFSVGMMGLILAGGRLRPRFWCRYLCPAGAVFALAGNRPLWRRTASDACIDCGQCQRNCPMGAIAADPRLTHHGECIACQACVEICPTQAVSFDWRPVPPPPPKAPASPDRRQAFSAAAAGTGLALIAMVDPAWPGAHGAARAGTGGAILRPPGAVPEADFLRRCIGCGLCMKACPTNTLQPVGLAAGISGLFSPGAVPRIGACEPRCNVCGQVCPTGVIRPLEVDDKIWAKIGTAFVLRHKCLAWEMNQPCLVCDEVCPYDAVSLRRVPGQATFVPFVDEKRCSGCGLCHHHCPVRPASAIVVEPFGALRLADGSYRAAARRIGLSLELKRPPSGLQPPGNSLEATSLERLPPGFTP